MPPMRKGPLIVALLAALMTGCGGGSGSTGTTAVQPFRIPITSPPILYEKEIRAKEASNGLYGKEPKVIMPEGTPPEILANRDVIEGIGHQAAAGSKVTIQYVAADYKTGRKLGKSSWEQGRPLTFTIGKGEVMEGLEQGVEGMEVGDRREMVIPPDLNTGPGVPAGIPPNTRVIIVADMLRVQEKPSEETSSKGEKTEASKAEKPKVTVPKGPPPKHLVEKELKKGSGPIAKAGDEVTIRYLGVFYKTGREFGSSWNGLGPFTFTVGTAEVMRGWSLGVEGMRVGGRRELIIPPKLALGSHEVDGTPPNSTLVFVIDLLAVK
jgi:peptidylprolyl isomerase